MNVHIIIWFIYDKRWYNIKIAITGKGGVGKKTFSSMLSRMFVYNGYRVVAIDADPDANLGLALGFPK